MVRCLLIAVIVAVSAPVASAQAFGVKMGTSIAEFSAAEKIEDTGPLKRYQVRTLPSPHSEFESYVLSATAAQGVCAVMGVGEDHTGDKFGVSVRGSYGELKSALTAKYGRGKEYDFVHSGALWDDSDEFAMSLKQGERSLAIFWSRENGSDMPEDLYAISLSAGATDSSTTYLKLTYEFANVERCRAEQTRRDNSGL